MRKRFLRYVSLWVLFCFVSTLCAPIVEAAQVVLVKVPGKNIMFDLNTASAGHLQNLPGIGPKTAAEIVRYRAKSGPFRSVNDLANVPGVGAARLRVVKSAASQGNRSNLQMKTQNAAKAQAAQKAKVQAAQAQAKRIQAQKVAQQKAQKVAQQRAAVAKANAQAKAAQQRVAQQKAAAAKAAATKTQQARDAALAKAKVEAQQKLAAANKAKAQQVKVEQAKVAAEAKASQVKAQQAKAQQQKVAQAKAQEVATAKAKAVKAQQQAQAKAKAAQAQAQFNKRASAKNAASVGKRVAPPKELWIQGPKGRVNLNNPNNSGLAGALTRAGFNNSEASQLMNARIQSGRFAEIKSYAELQGRMRVRNPQMKFLDGKGAYVKEAPQAPKKTVASKTREVKPRQPSAAQKAREAQLKQQAAKAKTAQDVARVKQQQQLETQRAQALEAKKAAALKAKRAQARTPKKVEGKQTASAKNPDQNPKAKSRGKVAPPAPEAKPELAQSKGKTVVRLKQGTRMVEVDVNGKQPAQLYRDLRKMGVSETAAREIATVRAKQQVSSPRELQAKAKAAKELQIAKEPRVRQQQPKKAAPAAPSNTAKAQAQANLAQIETQFKSISSRPLNSEVAVDRAVKGLTQTRAAFERYSKSADPQVAAQAKARLAEVDSAISKMQSNRRAVTAKNSVNQVKARLGSEIKSYAQQANELASTKPAGNAAGIDRQLRSARQTYDGLAKRIQTEAQINGKTLTSDQLIRDPRLAKLGESINGLNQAKRQLAQANQPKQQNRSQSNQQGKNQQLAEKPAAASNTRKGNMLDALKVETEARAQQRASATNVSKAGEAPVKQRIADLEAKLLKSGQFSSKADIYKASQQANATGEVRQLGNAIEELRGIRSARNGGGAVAASEPVVANEPTARVNESTARVNNEPAARVNNQPSEPLSNAANQGNGQGSAAQLREQITQSNTREGVVKGKIAYRMAKILESGQYSSPEQVYEAAQSKDARGDVKKLANAIDELRTIRETGQHDAPANRKIRANEAPKQTAEQVAQAEQAKVAEQARVQEAKAQQQAQAKARAEAARQAKLQQQQPAAEPVKTAQVNEPVAPVEPAAPAKQTWIEKMMGKPSAPATEPVAKVQPNEVAPVSEPLKVSNQAAVVNEPVAPIEDGAGMSTKTASMPIEDGAGVPSKTATPMIEDGAGMPAKTASMPIEDGAPLAKSNVAEPIAPKASETMPAGEGKPGFLEKMMFGRRGFAPGAEAGAETVAKAPVSEPMPIEDGAGGSSRGSMPIEDGAGSSWRSASTPIEDGAGSSYKPGRSSYDPTFGAFENAPLPADEGAPVSRESHRKATGFLDKMLGKGQAAPVVDGPDSVATASNEPVKDWASEYKQMLEGKGSAAVEDGVPGATPKKSWAEKLGDFFKSNKNQALADPAKAAQQPEYWDKFQEAVGGDKASATEQITARENELKLEAKELRGKLMKEGGFQSAEEVLKASQQQGAKGDLAKLQTIDSEISSLRSQKQAMGVGDGPASGSAGANLALDAETAGRGMIEDGAPGQPGKSQLIEDGAPGQPGKSQLIEDGAPSQQGKMQPIEDGAGPSQGGKPAPTEKSSNFTDWLTGKKSAGLVEDGAPAASSTRQPGGNALEPVATEPTAKGSETTAKTESTAPKSGGGFMEKLGNWSSGKGFKTNAQIAEATAAKAQASSGLPPEVAQMRQVNDKPAPVDTEIAKLEDTNLKLKEARAKSHDLAAEIKDSGKFKSIEEVQAKATEPGAKGKLGELAKVNEQIAELNQVKETTAKQIEAQPKNARGSATPEAALNEKLGPAEPAAKSTASETVAKGTAEPAAKGGQASEPVAAKGGQPSEPVAAKGGQVSEPVAPKAGSEPVASKPAGGSAPVENAAVKVESGAKPATVSEPVAAKGGSAPVAEPVVAKGGSAPVAEPVVAKGGAPVEGGAPVNRSAPGMRGAPAVEPVPAGGAPVAEPVVAKPAAGGAPVAEPVVAKPGAPAFEPVVAKPGAPAVEPVLAKPGAPAGGAPVVENVVAKPAAGGAPTAPGSTGSGAQAPGAGAPVVEPVVAKPGAPVVEPVVAKPGAPAVEPVVAKPGAPAGGNVPAAGPLAEPVGPVAGAPVEPVAPGAKPATGAVEPVAPGAKPATGAAEPVTGKPANSGTNTAASPAASTIVGPATDAISSLKLRNAEISRTLTSMEGQTGGLKGLFRRFFLMNNAAKTTETLKAELESNTQKIRTLEADPEAAAKATAAWKSDSKVQNALGQQGKLIQAYEAELAKVDAKSSYGKALTEKLDGLRSTPPESFAQSAKNMFVIAAGTNILMSLGRQIKNGEKVDLGEAVKSVANPAFLVGTAGTAVGAYLGTKLVMMPVASLLLTRVGSFLPPVGQVFVNLLPGFLGGALGGSLAGGLLGQKPDWALVMSQTLGSALGTALAMQFFPGLGMIGQIAGGMIGGWIAEKLLHMFRGDPKSNTEGAESGGATQASTEPVAPDPEVSKVTSYTSNDLNSAFANMQAAYQAYLQADKAGKSAEAAVRFQEYVKQKQLVDQYRKISYKGGATQASATAAAKPAGAAPAVPTSGSVQR